MTGDFRRIVWTIAHLPASACTTSAPGSKSPLGRGGGGGAARIGVLSSFPVVGVRLCVCVENNRSVACQPDEPPPRPRNGRSSSGSLQPGTVLWPASANWGQGAVGHTPASFFSTSISLPLLSTIQWRTGKYAADATACCARPSGNWCFSMSIAARAFDPPSVTLKRAAGAFIANT